MNALVDTAADLWSQWMIRSFIQGTLAFVLATAIWILFRRRAPAEFGCRLFLLVLLALVLPVSISLPEPFANHIPWKENATGRDNAEGTSPASGKNGTHATGSPASSSITAASEAPSPSHTLQTPTPSPGPSTTGIKTWLMLGWFAAVLAGAAHLALEQRKVHRLVRAATPVDPETLPFDLEALRKKAGIERAISIRRSDETGGAPAVCGLLSPVLVLPSQLLHRLDADQLSWTVAHELAHIRRGDLFILPLQYLAKLLFFFHPVAWLAHWTIGEFREHACDDEASETSGVKNRTCCEGFLKILEFAGGRPRVTFGMAGFNTPLGPIQRRLMRMMRRNGSRPYTLSLGYHAIVLFAALALLPHLRGRSTPRPETTPWLAPGVGTLTLTPRQPIGEINGLLVAPKNHWIEMTSPEGIVKKGRTGFQDYRVVEIATQSFRNPACLNLEVSVISGHQLGSFDLFPGNIEIPSGGAAQEWLRVKSSLDFAYDVRPGTSKRIAHFFEKGSTFQLGATGSWGTEVGMTSNFRVRAHVTDDYERMPRREVILTPDTPRRDLSGALPHQGYTLYLVDSTSFQTDGALVVQVSFPGSPFRGRLDLFDPELQIPKDPAFHKSVSAFAKKSLSNFTLQSGRQVRKPRSNIVVPFDSRGTRSLFGVSRPWIKSNDSEMPFELEIEVKLPAEGKK